MWKNAEKSYEILVFQISMGLNKYSGETMNQKQTKFSQQKFDARISFPTHNSWKYAHVFHIVIQKMI